jgi:hypothetical protein
MIQVQLPKDYLSRQVWLCVQGRGRKWEIRARDRLGCSFPIQGAPTEFTTKRHALAVLETLEPKTLWVESSRGATDNSQWRASHA